MYGGICVHHSAGVRKASAGVTGARECIPGSVLSVQDGAPEDLNS